MKLKGKTALITGGSKGIGLATALAFAREGASVAIAARTKSDLAQAADSIREEGGEAQTVVCDVTDADQVAAMAEAVGPLDILVNNAGIAASHKFVTHPDELWQKVMDVNLTSVYRVTKAVLPGMAARGGGRIINMASISSKTGSPYMAAYTASKHGVLGLTRALALELVDHNITVNAICPAYVNTPMTDQTIQNIMGFTGRSAEEARGYLENLSPQKRLMEPEEVAAVAVLLASDAARGINGQAINVDGGMVMF